jgi:branched-subunit amino acid transport protein
MSTVTLVVVIALLAAGTYGMRLSGAVLGGRLRLPSWLARLLPLAAVALLAALAATAAVTNAGHLAGVARPVGVLAGLVAAWRKAPFVLVVVIAAGTAALLRVAGVS